MAHADTKQKLLAFLEEKALQPVMRADPASYPANRRDMLKDVQRRTEAEIKRFRGYRSADDVVTNFRRDLDSAPAKKVHQELKALGLPTINDVRREFETLARELGAK